MTAKPATERRRVRAPVWGSLAVVVCLIAGLLLATARTTSHGNELRSSDSGRLSDLVRAAQRNVDDADRQRNELADRVEQQQRRAASSDRGVATALHDAENLAPAAGLTPLTGPGVVVTLTDATRDAQGRYPREATPDDLVIHQQDVQSALNGLWVGGAEAVGMQDQRVVGTSAPRCIGNTLLLHGRTYSPPYVLTAIGDSARILAALDNEPGIRLLKQYAAKYGLGYSAVAAPAVQVPGYDGRPADRFAQPGGG